jgi:hypothetical protein
MSYYSYLFRKDTKTSYELGKNFPIYSDIQEVFEIKKQEPLLEEDLYGEEREIPCLLIERYNRDLLYLCIKKYFPEDFDTPDEQYPSGYINYVTDTILDFCDDKPVYFLSDCHDTYHDLKYKVTHSRYFSPDDISDKLQHEI